MDIKNVDLFFSDNPNPMWIYDPADLSIQEVNQSALKLYGYTRREMCSMTIEELRPASDVDKLKEHLRKDRDPEFNNVGVWRHQKKNGDNLFVRVLTSSVSYEDNNYKLVVVQDVTRKIDYQQKYEMLFEHSLDGVMLTNPNGDILQANSAACKILGMTEEEIIHKGREGLVAKDEKLEQALEERSATGKFSGELNYIHNEGHKIPVELTTSVFKNYAGEKRTSLIFRDISERKEREQALREEKEFTGVVLNNLPGVFYVLDWEGKIVRFNEHATEVFGVPAEKIKGRSAVEFAHASDKEKVPHELKKVLTKGYSSFELTLNIAGGNTAVYRFNGERLEQNDQTFVVGNGVDITKQKELQEQLSTLLKKEQTQRKKAENDHDKLKKMFEKAPTPKCLLEGREMKFVIANKAYRHVVGQEDIIGKRVTEVIPEVEEQGYIDILNQVYDTGKPYVGHGELIYFDKGKKDEQQEYIFNLLYEPLFNDEGEVYGIFVEAVDFSEQIAYQVQLEESLKEKETLLAEIHHRVKNNLAIITSMMELQAMDTDKSELQDSLKVAQQRIQTIATIHELLYRAESLSHLNFGENIAQLVRNLKQVYNGSKQITVTVETDPIRMNINQAIPCALLVNEVVTNAYKHAFKHREKGEIAITLQENNEEVLVTVTDNGVGLPADFMQKNSSSIGMTLIKLLEQQLEGEIKFSDRNGTHFELSFKKTDVKGIGSSLVEN